MTTEIKLLFFAGSARRASHNMRLAKLAHDIAQANGIAASFADLRDYSMPIYDGDEEAANGLPEAAQRFKDLMAAHRGIFIACPEYNSSVTPLLKNTLDWVSRVRSSDEAPLEVFRSRIFALGGASPGGLGAIRALTDLRKILELGLGALVLPEQLAVPRAESAFDDHGHLDDKAAQEKLKAIIQRLAHSARVMTMDR